MSWSMVVWVNHHAQAIDHVSCRHYSTNLSVLVIFLLLWINLLIKMAFASLFRLKSVFTARSAVGELLTEPMLKPRTVSVPTIENALKEAPVEVVEAFKRFRETFTDGKIRTTALETAAEEVLVLEKYLDHKFFENPKKHLALVKQIAQAKGGINTRMEAQRQAALPTASAVDESQKKPVQDNDHRIDTDTNPRSAFNPQHIHTMIVAKGLTENASSRPREDAIVAPFAYTIMPSPGTLQQS